MCVGADDAFISTRPSFITADITHELLRRQLERHEPSDLQEGSQATVVGIPSASADLNGCLFELQSRKDGFHDQPLFAIEFKQSFEVPNPVLPAVWRLSQQ